MSRSKIENDFETPGALGYAMPPEWAPHEATWIAWPHYHEDWPGKFEPIPWIYAELVRLLSHGTLHSQATDRGWVRDTDQHVPGEGNRPRQGQHCKRRASRSLQPVQHGGTLPDVNVRAETDRHPDHAALFVG